MQTFVRRAGSMLFWTVMLLETLSMADAGLGKFQSLAGWQTWFTKWGYGAWTAQVVGAVEILGAVLLFVPRLASYSASVLIVVMAVAAHTNAFKESDMSTFDPMLHMTFLTIILVVRWGRRWRGETARPAGVEL